VLAELGDERAAADDLQVYLAHRPDADDAPALAERLNELRGAGPARWH
jgi:regulator of sirC expression with transglutaminase-like and TPR domain